MLLDSIDRLHLYNDKIPHLAEALAKLEEVKDGEPGRFEFEGGYLMIQTGVCKPMDSNEFEVHRNYVDVQCLLDGEEWFEWADLRDLENKDDYNEAKDKGTPLGYGMQFKLSPGVAVAFWPNDAHKPGRCPNGGKEFRKAVLKLLVK